MEYQLLVLISVYEQIIDGKTGYIAKDEDEFVDKLIYLMNNEKELKKMSQYCKKFNSQFDIDNVCDKWEELFKNIR